LASVVSFEPFCNIGLSAQKRVVIILAYSSPNSETGVGRSCLLAPVYGPCWTFLPRTDTPSSPTNSETGDARSDALPLYMSHVERKVDKVHSQHPATTTLTLTPPLLSASGPPMGRSLLCSHRRWVYRRVCNGCISRGVYPRVRV